MELTVAGEALLDRARKVLGDVDGAVSAAMAVGGELISRVTKMWQPLEGRLAGDVDLRTAREAAEEMQGQLAPPPGTQVRPVVAGGVPALVVAPTGISTPTVMYLHGGAYVLGSAYGHRPHAGALAIAAHAGVLVPDYRLAPEHPFPAAVEDSVCAYLWLLDQGVAAEQIKLVGDSSGAGLALSLLLTLKARETPLPGAVALFCPWLDLRLEQGPAGPAPPGLSLEEARRCIRMYLGEHPADDPIADPSSADLTGLPPMLDPGRYRRRAACGRESSGARARPPGRRSPRAVPPSKHTHFSSSGRSFPKPPTRSKPPECSSASALRQGSTTNSGSHGHRPWASRSQESHTSTARRAIGCLSRRSSCAGRWRR